MAGAFLYLTVCSIRNSVRIRLRRLRQPRYLVIALGLALYVGSILFSRPPQGFFTIPADSRQLAGLAAAIVLTGLLGLAWVLPNSVVLPFTSAEVQFLFPAPVSRRQLIGYKISRLMLATAALSIVFTMILAPPRMLAAASVAGRAFVVMAVMTLYQTGVSLHRKRTDEGMRARGRHRPGITAVALALLPAFGWALARVALGSAGELAVVLPITAALVVGCGFWILQSDAAFEEAATESAEKIQRAIKSGSVLRPRLRPDRASAFALAPQGRLESAILWKNWMLIGRTPWASIGFGVFILTSFVGGLWIAGARLDRDIIGLICFVVALAIILFGPNVIRADLRQDLANLALIKSWPVSGAAVFRGELLAPLIALALGLVVPVLLGCVVVEKVFIGGSTVGARASLAVVALLVGSSVMLALLVIHNGVAVSFPAWVRVTPGGGAGHGVIEMMGQNMVMLYGGMLVALIASIAPAGAAAAAWFLFGGSPTTQLIAGALFAGLLFLECAAATEVLGRVLDRIDLQDVATSWEISAGSGGTVQRLPRAPESLL